MTSRKGGTSPTSSAKTFFEIGYQKAIGRAAKQRSTHTRQPMKGDIVCWWRDQGSGATSKRLQLATGWHGPALVIGAEGTTKIFLSYRGLPVLVSPEQCRQPSADEVEMLGWLEMEEDSKSLVEKFRKYNTQNGFIDERPSKKARVLEDEGDEPPITMPLPLPTRAVEPKGEEAKPEEKPEEPKWDPFYGTAVPGDSDQPGEDSPTTPPT